MNRDRYIVDIRQLFPYLHERDNKNAFRDALESFLTNNQHFNQPDFLFLIITSSLNRSSLKVIKTILDVYSKRNIRLITDTYQTTLKQFIETGQFELFDYLYQQLNDIGIDIQTFNQLNLFQIACEQCRRSPRIAQKLLDAITTESPSLASLASSGAVVVATKTNHLNDFLTNIFWNIIPNGCLAVVKIIFKELLKRQVPPVITPERIISLINTCFQRPKSYRTLQWLFFSNQVISLTQFNDLVLIDHQLFYFVCVYGPTRLAQRMFGIILHAESNPAYDHDHKSILERVVDNYFETILRGLVWSKQSKTLHWFLTISIKLKHQFYLIDNDIANDDDDATANTSYDNYQHLDYHYQSTKQPPSLSDLFRQSCLFGSLETTKVLYDYLLTTNQHYDFHAREERLFSQVCQVGKVDIVVWLYKLSCQLGKPFNLHRNQEQLFRTACRRGQNALAQTLVKLSQLQENEPSRSIDLTVYSGEAFRSACQHGTREGLLLAQWLQSLRPELFQINDSSDLNAIEYEIQLPLDYSLEYLRELFIVTPQPLSSLDQRNVAVITTASNPSQTRIYHNESCQICSSTYHSSESTSTLEPELELEHDQLNAIILPCGHCLCHHCFLNSYHYTNNLKHCYLCRAPFTSETQLFYI